MSTFQAVWPITDPGMPATDLFAEAACDLHNVALRHRVRVTGKPRFQVRAGRRVPGSQGAAYVITCNVEAEALGPRNYGGPSPLNDPSTNLAGTPTTTEASSK